MGRTLFVITPAIVASAREFFTLSQAGKVVGIHLAECFPVPPESILSIWDDAQFDLLRRNGQRELELTSIAVFKNGTVAAQFTNKNHAGSDLPLFAGLDEEPTSNS